MVHVVSCHHFVSQDVFLSKREPVAFCCAEEKLFVVTDQQTINVHDLDSRGNVLHTFPTVDRVTQVVFCEKGNYVATLEKKTLKQGNVQTFVRIYFKWWMDFTAQSPKSRTANSSNSHLKNQPEMLELPLKSSTVLAITCCQKTAALAISLGNTISVFCQSWTSSDILKLNQSYFHHVMDIELNFTVKELCIYERYFACQSDNQIRVFKVTAESDNNQVPTANANSFDDLKNGNFAENFIEWRFESCLENGSSDIEWENHLREHLHPSSFPITTTFPTIEKANQIYGALENCEIFGPILTIKGHKIKANLDDKALEIWSCLSTSNIIIVTLLYREFALQEDNKLVSLKLIPFSKSDELTRSTLDPLHAAAIESEKATSTLGSPFQYSDETKEAVGCFFSTSREGFLYDICHGIKMIGLYPYTAPLKAAVVEPSFLHALTDAGLETYTLHLPHCAVRHLENVDNVKNACPDFNSPICLLGLRPFLGAHSIAISENYLVLISSSEELDINIETPDAEGCTIYALKKPPPQQIFSDLLEVGQVCKTSSPTTYQIVLSEGHMILRTHLLLGKPRKNELRNLYLKSCILMADHYICNSSDKESVLAAPYYHMSQLPVEEVVQRFFGFRNKLKQNVLKPLIHYLNPVLIESKPPIVVSVSKSVAENILDAYMDEAPDHLWKVILCSGLIGYRVEKAMMMLKRRITSKRNLLSSYAIAADTVAIVSLLLKKNNTDAAQNMMLSLLKSDLIALLTDIRSVILSNVGISSLGKFAMQVRPDAFIEMMIRLVEKDEIKIPDVIHTLQVESADEQIHQIGILKDFLEILIHDKKHLIEKNPDCVMLLVKIYLKRLIEKQPIRENATSVKNSNPIIMGPRPSWLNEMPPFYGKSILRTCSLSDLKTEKLEPEECLCRVCQEDLLKLQALLYQNRSSMEIREQVLEFVLSGEHICGYESLSVLCLDEERAIKRLLDVAPSAVLPFALDLFGSDERKWHILFSTLQKKMSEISEDHNKYEIYSKTFQGVIQHLAETMTVLNFISILPRGDAFYEPYVKLCIKKHRAKQLKDKIIALGNEIKALM